MHRATSIILVAVAVSILATFCAATAVAQAPVAGLADVIIRPEMELISPQLRQLKLQRRLEVPTDLVLNGIPAVQYSYGTFKLLTLVELGNQGRVTSPDSTQAVPPDEHHAATDVDDLTWNRFHNVMHLMTSVKDQGQRGTCHVQAATGLAEAMYNRRIQQLTGRPYEIDLSEQWLQYMVKYNADFSHEAGDGGSTFGDMERIRDEGHVPEIYWTYESRHWSGMSQYQYLAGDTPGQSPWPWRCVAQTTTGQPPNEVTQAIARRTGDPGAFEDFRIKDCVEGGSGTTGVNFIINKINAGIPVAIWVPWPRSVMIARGCILYVPDECLDKTRQELWDDKYTSGANAGQSKWFRGGHALIITGYGKSGTPAEDLFAFKNSWSRWWGNDGYGYFTKSWLIKFMNGCGVCEIDSH